MTEFPFTLAEWAPDRPDLNNAGMIEAKNCIPASEGYKPFRSLAAANSSALTSSCIGAYSSTDKNLASFVYAGTDNKLYQVTETTLTDRSLSGGYSVTSLEHWEFAQFGQVLVAVNIDTATQKLTLGTTAFANLGGSPPKARHVTNFGDFLVLANVNDSGDGLVPNRVHWSGFNNVESWTAGTGQSDYQNLPAGFGEITSLVSTNVLLAFQERAITRFHYEGPPTIMRAETFERGRGAAFARAAISNGVDVFYIAQDGFFITDGTRSYPIGQGKADRWFFDNLNQSVKHLISSALDPVNKLVVWAFPSQASTINDRLIIYDWGNKKWSYVEENIQFIFTGLTVGYTTDGLSSYEPLVDNITLTVDDRFFSGGDLLLMGFDPNNKLATFSGAKKTAVLTTPEVNLNTGGTAMVRAVRSFTDGTSSIKVGTRQQQKSAVTLSSAQTLNSIGEADFREDARYHRVELSISDEWTFAHGGMVDYEPTGGR